MSIAAIGAIAAPIIGGMIGSKQAGKDRDLARQMSAQALAQFAGIDAPDIGLQELELLLPELVGQYEPGLEGSIGLDPSAMEGVSTDPRLAQAQMQALQQLSEIGETGLREGEASALREIRRGSAREAEARQGAILQEMAQRGVGGSGVELAARLSAGQASADRQSSEGDRLAQMAQSRALQAITQSGQLGSQIRSQDFGEQSDVAKARDVVNRFNTQNRQQIQQRNVAAQNQAKLRNLQEQQRISEASLAQQNYQQEKNKGLIQSQFDNQLGLASARAGQNQAASSAANTRAGQTASMWSGIGQGVGTGFAAFGNQKPTSPSGIKTADDDGSGPY